MIKAFKPLTTEDQFKGNSKTYSAFKIAGGSPLTYEASTNNTYLEWFMVERTSTSWSDATDDMKNLFHSFGIARQDEDDWFHAFGTLVDYYNAKRMIIASIPDSECGSYLDGSTLKLNVPVTTSAQYVTLYGSTYGGYTYKNSQGVTYRAAEEYDRTGGVYGGAYCYLFGNTVGAGNLNVASDAILDGEHPYTGNVDGAANINAAATSWDSFVVNAGDPHIAATHRHHGDDGHDAPMGIAFLEKGIFVVFDSYGRDDLIQNYSGISTAGTVWVFATTPLRAITTTGGTEVQNTNVANRKNIYFTGGTANKTISLIYRSVTDEYKMIYFCHAGQNEFNSTTNHTYNHSKAYFKPEESDSIWVTEIALYASDSDLPLAYAKLSEPVEKTRLDTLTFKVSLNL